MVWHDYPRTDTVYQSVPLRVAQPPAASSSDKTTPTKEERAARVHAYRRELLAEKAFQQQILEAEKASLAEMQRHREASLAVIQREREKEIEELMLQEAQRASLEEGSNRVQMALEASRLAAKALAYNLEEVEVPRDGNCQFHSTAQSLSELNSGQSYTMDHAVVRKEAVEWLRNHQHFRLNPEDADTTLVHYLDADPNWETYCDRMSRHAQYGDHLTLIGIAERFSCCVVVVTSEVDGVNYHVRPRDATPQDTLYLAHYPLAQHYNRLMLRGEAEVADSATWTSVPSLVLQEHLTTGFAYKVLCPNGQLRRIRTEYNATQGRLRLGHAELREHIAQMCTINPQVLSLRWRDADGDLITFDTDEELLDAVRCAAAQGQKVLRIYAEESQPAGSIEEWCLVDADPVEGDESEGVLGLAISQSSTGASAQVCSEKTLGGAGVFREDSLRLSQRCDAPRRRDP